MRILVISDHKGLRRTLQALLEREDYFVELSDEADDADARVHGDNYDVLLLALRATDTNLILLQHWRRDGVSAHIVVLLPSVNLRDRVRCLDLGADSYMNIPIHPDELLARLRALARRQQVPDPILKIHDLEINRATHTVKRRGQPIRLTPREYALLHFLASHQGRVVTRSMIWNHLYDEYDRNTSNVVDVYIRYLRNKIDRGFETPLILTRWGEGYMLCGESA